MDGPCSRGVHHHSASSYRVRNSHAIMLARGQLYQGEDSRCGMRRTLRVGRSNETQRLSPSFMTGILIRYVATYLGQEAE